MENIIITIILYATENSLDWLITAKGELEKAKDKSLKEYHWLLGEEIKEVRLHWQF